MGERESRLEWPELRLRHPLIGLVGLVRAGHDADVMGLGLQLRNEINRPAEVEIVDETGGIRKSFFGAGAARKEDDGRIGKELVQLLADELEDRVLNGDDDVELDVFVLQPEKIAE